MSYLPWLLLASTITVRVLIAKKWRQAFYVDLVSVVPWLAYYWHNGSYPLLVVPVLFGALDVKALLHWWNPNAS